MSNLHGSGILERLARKSSKVLSAKHLSNMTAPIVKGPTLVSPMWDLVPLSFFLSLVLASTKLPREPQTCIWNGPNPKQARKRFCKIHTEPDGNQAMLFDAGRGRLEGQFEATAFPSWRTPLGSGGRPVSE